MGEIADAMLDGTLCSSCGDYLGGDEGFPVVCEVCKREERRQPRVPRFNRYSIQPSKPRADQVACGTCGRVVKKVGLAQHMRDKHSQGSGS